MEKIKIKNKINNKKIINIIIILLELIILLNLNSKPIKSNDDKTYYKEEINNLITEITNLKQEIQDYKIKVEEIVKKYNELNNQMIQTKTKEDIINFFNKANIYATRSNVIVKTKSYNTFLGITTSSSNKKNAGIIIKQDQKNYYILTTTADIQKDSNYSKRKLEILDSFNLEYQAEVVFEDFSYNLTLLKVAKEDNDLYSLELSTTTNYLEEEEIVINIHSIIYSNSEITFNHMELVKEYDLSNNKLLIDSINTNGYNGSMIINDELELIGIGDKTKTIENLKYNQAITTNTILECLNKYQISL